MATVTLTNPGSEDVTVSELYATVKAGKTHSFERAAVDIARLGVELQGYLVASTLTMTVAYSATEVSAGLMTAPGSVGGDDFAAADPDANFAFGGVASLKVGVPPEGGGAPGDTTVYGADTLPWGLGGSTDRVGIMDAWMFVDTSVAGTVELRTAGGGGGTLIASGSSAATGRVALEMNGNAPPQLLFGNPLVVRRSDNAAGLTMFILVRPEFQT